MKLHHIGIATENLETSIQQHKVLFNINPVTDIVKDPILNVSLVLLSNSEKTCVPIELVSPSSDESPVSNLLKKGIHLYHLCYIVSDIKSALKNARKHKAIIISEPTPAKLYNGRRIAFIYMPAGYVVEFLEEKPQDS